MRTLLGPYCKTPTGVAIFPREPAYNNKVFVSCCCSPDHTRTSRLMHCRNATGMAIFPREPAEHKTTNS
jgi:hypothetical protein